MKNIFKYLAVTVISIATLGLTACDPEPTPGPDNPTTESTSYAFHYQNRALEQNQTIYYYPTAQEVANNWATVHLFMENKTDVALETYMKVEVENGPESFNNLSICFGETCKTGTCPWKYGPINLTPGVNTNMEVLLDYLPSNAAEANGVYRITIGKGADLEDPQVMFLSMSSQAQ
jgi:hypothetical protein